MPFKLAVLRYDYIVANSQKAFVESAGIDATFPVSSESCNHICRNFGSFGLPGSFFSRQYYIL